MPVINLVAIAKLGLRYMFFVFLIGMLVTFTHYLLSLIPPMNLNGCLGYWVNSLGLILAIRMIVSIVVYAFIFKFGISLFSKSLD